MQILGWFDPKQYKAFKCVSLCVTITKLCYQKPPSHQSLSQYAQSHSILLIMDLLLTENHPPQREEEDFHEVRIHLLAGLSATHDGDDNDDDDTRRSV